MFVLTAEGPSFLDGVSGATHQVLGVYASKAVALAALKGPYINGILRDPGCIVLLTDLVTKDVVRVSA